MRLRQAVFAAAEMEPLRSQLFELFGLDDAFVDPGVGFFGLTNVVMALGDSFLEVVVPEKEGTTAGRLLDRRGQTCGYMLIFQVDDFATQSKHLSAGSVWSVWCCSSTWTARSRREPTNAVEQARPCPPSGSLSPDRPSQAAWH